ncbi:hexameric tyrosine-coordinated heme protein [Streptomyces sp. MMS20-AI2-20]|uniref:hexameric tyrosine-coordinated heme protein n=1 Tax=Streptomyces sp. MMS20-AI2-20 TaxID=2925835 RepID=UPI001F62026E|nr:hexameric tyrosine-coordinated heme protein [Streptomyces sp. MMS20-AI2-20]MCI4146587.1 hexameric tyrosine-coordinated heme protein [Streptomyces sp. MMS20-AI2-20]
MSETWLPTLRTGTPQEGWELAVRMSRVGVKATQPSAEVRDRLREGYAENADSLIAASQVIAVNFQTIAAANQYWAAG